MELMTPQRLNRLPTQKRLDWTSNNRFRMSCSPTGTPGVCELDVGTSDDIHVYHLTSGNTRPHTLSSLGGDSIAAGVIDISVNNGNYTLSDAAAPFKFQWVDTKSVAITTQSILQGRFATSLNSTSITENTVIPVYDDSQGAWKDVYGTGVSALSDKCATFDPPGTDGDAFGVATVDGITTATSSVKTSRVLLITADYFLTGIISTKPMIMIAGWEGSAANDQTGGALLGP